MIAEGCFLHQVLLELGSALEKQVAPLTFRPLGCTTKTASKTSPVRTKTVLLFESLVKAISSSIPSIKPGRGDDDATVARNVVAPSLRHMGPHTTVYRAPNPASTKSQRCLSMGLVHQPSQGSKDYPGIQWTDDSIMPFFMLNTSIPMLCRAIKSLNSKLNTSFVERHNLCIRQGASYPVWKDSLPCKRKTQS